MYTVQCRYMVEEPISLSVAARSNIGTDKSAAYSSATLRHMHSCYLPNPNSFICEASHREAVSTTFKVFDLTRLRWIRNLDLPNSKRTLYHYTMIYFIFYYRIVTYIFDLTKLHYINMLVNPPSMYLYNSIGSSTVCG